MTVTTAHDLQRERILAACRLAAVADAAGVADATWASTSAPRVLVGDAGGYVAGLHRGRLPAIEVYQDDDAWERVTATGGTLRTTWVLRAHVADLTKQAAESRARAILLTALASLRSDEYLDEGGDAFGALEPGPFGHVLEARVSLVHSYDRNTYETDATITAGDPVVVIPGTPGGSTLRVSFNMVSPVVVFVVPEGQALDGIDVHVETAWDGTGASLTLGTPLSPATFFSTSDVELDAEGATFSKTFDTMPGPVTVRATFAPGVGASQGLCRVQVSTTAAGT